VAVVSAAACAAPTAPSAELSSAPTASAAEPSGPAGSTASSPPNSGAPAPESFSTVMVVADELRLRDVAGTGGEVVDGLSWGAVASVLEGPADADGFRWYRLESGDGSSGWAAAGDGEDDWLVPVVVPTDGQRRIELSSVCDVVGPVVAPDTTILDDGLVVTTTLDGAWVAGVLSADGMRSLEDEILSNPYLQQEAEYVPVPKPGAEPPGHGACTYTFRLGPGDDPLTVTSVMYFGDPEETQFYQPAPERKALTKIAQSLADIESVLPPGAWEVQPLPYVADEYLAWLLVEPGPMQGPFIDFGDLGIDGSAADFGEPVQGASRCGVLGRDAATRVHAGLRTTGVEAGLDRFGGGPMRDGDDRYTLLMVPRTPLGVPNCDGLR
jgi:hypothetical protein